MKLGKYAEWSICTGHRHGFSINKPWVALNSWPSLMVGVCITWRYWVSYSFDVQSTHRKSRFSEHSRSEAPRQLLGSELQSVSAGTRFVSAFFLGLRHPRFASFSFSHMDGHFCLPQHSVWKSLFLHSFIFRRDIECGVNQVVGVTSRAFFNWYLGWFVGKGAFASIWSCQIFPLTFTDKGGDLVLMPWNFPPFC